MDRYNFDLDQELLKELAEEFDPLNFVKGLILNEPKDVEDARTSFERYGTHLAIKGIKKGEERPDRIYEVMKEAIEKTGEMHFPLIPQRYIEIAYLSIQPIRRIWILSNDDRVFSYRLNDCTIYHAIEKGNGEQKAKKMVCKYLCFAIIREIFSHFGFNVDTFLDANMESHGKCQFRIECEKRDKFKYM